MSRINELVREDVLRANVAQAQSIAAAYSVEELTALIEVVRSCESTAEALLILGMAEAREPGVVERVLKAIGPDQLVDDIFFLANAMSERKMAAAVIIAVIIGGTALASVGIAGLFASGAGEAGLGAAAVGTSGAAAAGGADALIAGAMARVTALPEIFKAAGAGAQTIGQARQILSGLAVTGSTASALASAVMAPTGDEVPGNIGASVTPTANLVAAPDGGTVVPFRSTRTIAGF